MATKARGAGKAEKTGATRDAAGKTVVLSQDQAAAVPGTQTVQLPSEGSATLQVVRDGGQTPPSPAPEAEPTPAEEPKPVPARFEDQGEIGRGGMGAVHRVFDHAVHRLVAQKRLHDEVREIPGAAMRFREEAQVTGQLDHPNIVPVHDVGVDEHGVVTSFTMQFVRGKTLKAMAAEAHDVGLAGGHIETMLQIFLKVCDAVAFAHSRGVVHRDLKPENIMVGPHGQVYLMDWGAAQLVRHGRPGGMQVTVSALGAEAGSGGAGEPARALIGTPAYMAPEQAQERTADIDERTDVFGLGGILYHILTNRPPYAADTTEEVIAQACHGAVASPQGVVTDVQLPPGLCRIAMRALAADPTLRYRTVEALHDDVVAFLRGGGWFRTLVMPAGTEIVREGEDPDAAYIITRGWCEAYRVMEGRKQSLCKMGPGDVFGEISIFTKQPRTATVVALDEVHLTEITLDTLERESGPRSWMYALVKALAKRFVDIDHQLSELRTYIDT